MLDIKFIREHPDVIRKDLKKRKDEEKIVWVDEILKKDEEYRQLLQEVQKLRTSRNIISAEVNTLRKEGKDFSGRLKEAQLNVNGRMDVLSQRDPKFIREISGVVKDGNNFIGVMPMTDLNVMSVEVRVE